jgi:Glu-tRNA(Gln) amidotransferase subunit E-like FAD-binding protein
MSEQEVHKNVEEIVANLKSSGTLPAGAGAMGPVMKQVMAKIGSRADGKVVQASVRKVLGMA